MNAVISAMNFSPLFRDAFDLPALTKQTFISNKACFNTTKVFPVILLSIPPFSFNRESLCLEFSTHHVFLSAKSGTAGLSRIFFFIFNWK